MKSPNNQQPTTRTSSTRRFPRPDSERIYCHTQGSAMSQSLSSFLHSRPTLLERRPLCGSNTCSCTDNVHNLPPYTNFSDPCYGIVTYFGGRAGVLDCSHPSLLSTPSDTSGPEVEGLILESVTVETVWAIRKICRVGPLKFSTD